MECGVSEDNGESGRMKVVDKRMFTAEGELREDFRHLESEASEAVAPVDEAPPAPPPAQAEPAPPPPVEPEPEPPEPPAAERPEMPETEGALGTPGFMDLVAVLAEPIALYMGDAQLPDGSSAENLDAARLYIDLLEVLHSKTAGNLTTQEAAVLDDLLYQLRLRYVRKRG